MFNATTLPPGTTLLLQRALLEAGPAPDLVRSPRVLPAATSQPLNPQGRPPLHQASTAPGGHMTLQR